MTYILFTCTLVALAASIFLKLKNKKKPLKIAFGSFLVLLTLMLITIMSGKNVKKEAEYITKTQMGALGWGAGEIISKKVPNAKNIVLLTYGNENRVADIFPAFKSANGNELKPFFAMSGNPSMRTDPAPVYDKIAEFFKETKADAVIIDMAVRIVPECLEGFKGAVLVYSDDEPIDEKLSGDKRILGRIKLNPRFVPENTSSNPEKAFAQNYEFVQ